MMLAVAASAIFLTIVTAFGPQQLGLTLGFIALAGLALHAAGFEPPRIIVLGWWFVLLFYVMLSLLALAGVLPGP